MADIAVAVTSLTANALSTALDTATYSVATGNYAVIAAQGATRGLILTFDGDAASTVTLISGDQPPSENSGNGNSAALVIANGKQYVAVTTGVGGGSPRVVPRTITPEINPPANGHTLYVFELQKR